jgi:hypothetical protein
MKTLSRVVAAPHSRINTGAKTGAGKAWNGLIDSTGRMLNVDEVIPSKRERLELSAPPQERQR